MLQLKKDEVVAINGYRGDNETRVIKVDTVHPNRVVGFDINRQCYRAYLFTEIKEITRVKFGS